MISPGMSSCEHSLNTLRYADRVKELAANDPSEMKTSPSSEGELMKMDDNGMLDDSDLAQLRSLNVILILKPLTPELNSSAQRCLMRFFFYWGFCFLNHAVC
jgi:hypothetical protein